MKRWLYVLVPALVLFGLIGWRLNQKKAETADQAKQRQSRGKSPLLVDVAPVTNRDIVHAYDAVGSIEAPFAVDLTPRVSGRIEFLQVREGDKVQAGQVLARIDPTEVEALVRQKEADLAQAQLRLAQAQVTRNATDVSVLTDVQKQQATLATARAQSTQARANQEAQIASAQSNIQQAQSKIDSANSDIASAEATIKTAQANLANARVNRDRQVSLVKEGATAQQNLDNAETLVQVQEGALGEAQQKKTSAVAARDAAISAKGASEKQLQIVQNQIQADIAATNASVAQAKAALTASQANRSQAPAYQKNLEALQAAVRAAEADLHATQAQREYTVLRSPMTGVVTARNLDLGALASPTTPIVSLQALQQVWLTAAAPEEITRSLAPGQVATVSLDALPGKTFTGKIERINPAADPQSRQFTIRVRLDNPQNSLRPGMFGRVHLVTERVANALTVPREAVKQNADGKGATVALVTENGTAHVQPVTTGASDDKYVAITNGLEAGEPVIILAGRDVKDGQQVKVAGKGKGDKSAPPAPTNGGARGSGESPAGSGTPISGGGGGNSTPEKGAAR